MWRCMEPLCLLVLSQMRQRWWPFSNTFTEETIRELVTGDYFGEQALLKTDLRTANIIALSNVECLTLDRE